MIYRGELVEAIAESVPLLVADLDTGEILWASRPLETMFGYHVHGELVGKSVEELVPAASRAAHVGHRQGFAADPKARSMGHDRLLSGQRRDGSVIRLEIGLSAMVISGQRCVIAVAVAVPERSSCCDGADTAKTPSNPRSSEVLMREVGS